MPCVVIAAPGVRGLDGLWLVLFTAGLGELVLQFTPVLRTWTSGDEPS